MEQALRGLPDPPILAFFVAKKSKEPPKKSKDFSPAEPQNPWKREQKRTKEQGNLQNKKGKEREKSKDWRVRVLRSLRASEANF